MEMGIIHVFAVSQASAKEYALLLNTWRTDAGIIKHKLNLHSIKAKAGNAGIWHML